jgi:hypothetical protein
LKRPQEKHLPYFRVLEALSRGQGCALCALEDAAVSRYLEGILYEKVNDPSIRADLRKSSGFCARHAHRLAALGDGLGTAILYRDQVALILEALDREARAPAGRGRRRTAASADRGGSCPACRLAEESRARSLRTLLDALPDADMNEALRASQGLCYPHLRAALEHADERHRAELIEIHRPKVAELLGLLEEYRRRQDYRFASEGDADERDSWLRAVEEAVGRKGVF